VFSGTDPNGTDVGQYVSMRIDKTGDHIHIAAYRAEGSGLVYIKGTRSGGSYTFGSSVLVDENNAGRWADLSLDANGNPWITYMNNSKAGNYGGAKIAFLDSSKYTKAFTDLNGVNATGWEYLVAGAPFRVYENRLSIENYPVRGGPGSPTARNFSAAVAYASQRSASAMAQERMRIAYYIKD
jgi:hypothetical protein